MADGTLVPIEDVDVGDMVWSANPVTGEAGPEQVVATIVGHGTKTLVEITTNTATVTATGGHPFWVTNQHRWTGAQDIQPGDHLLNQHRDTVVVDQIAITKAANQTVHNLTITNHHTYAVGPDHDAILTHNCNAPRLGPISRVPSNINPQLPRNAPHIPDNARIRDLTPSDSGGAQHGVEFIWQNSGGVTTRVRIHGPDGNAPSGSNAATGDVVRIQVGGRHMDADGNLHPRGVFKPNSPNCNEALVNDLHIPWQR